MNTAFDFIENNPNNFQVVYNIHSDIAKNLIRSLRRHDGVFVKHNGTCGGKTEIGVIARDHDVFMKKVMPTVSRAKQKRRWTPAGIAAHAAQVEKMKAETEALRTKRLAERDALVQKILNKAA